jgi:hypothetical protein
VQRSCRAPGRPDDGPPDGPDQRRHRRPRPSTLRATGIQHAEHSGGFVPSALLHGRRQARDPCPQTMRDQTNTARRRMSFVRSPVAPNRRVGVPRFRDVGPAPRLLRPREHRGDHINAHNRPRFTYLFGGQQQHRACACSYGSYAQGLHWRHTRAVSPRKRSGQGNRAIND